MSNKIITPPRWAQRLLHQFAAPDTREEVEGDLAELFNIWQTNYGIQKANWLYVRTVFTLLRPFAKRKKTQSYNLPTNHSIMFLSYFKMSWRTILKNRVSSLINISGLTLGLCTSIVIALVVMDELKYDQFHSNLDDIYQLMKNQKTNDGISTSDATPGPLAQVLRSDFPEVKYAARTIQFGGEQFTVDNKIKYESGTYADPDLFRIMTFKPLYGDATSALESNSAIITRDMALKWFSHENAVGKTILFNKSRALTIGAVVENVPHQSTVRFEIVLPFTILEKNNKWLTKWDDNRIMTWVQLQPNANSAQFGNKLTQWVQERSNDRTFSLFAYPFGDLYLHNSFSNGLPNGGRITAIQMLIAFGVFMLFIACINFMNIATAQSEYRAREVGVRKVLGASRRWIIVQFLNESFIITFVSMFIAIALTLLIIPSFNTITHSSISFDFNNGSIWISILGIGLVTTFLAGSYPSLFLSRFQPAKVLKGKTGSLKGGGLRRALVTVQFVISAFFLIATTILYSQFEYVKDRPIGYDQQNLIDISLDSTLSAKFAYLKTEALKIPNIVAVTGSSNNILNANGSVTGMDWPGKRAGDDLSVAIGDVGYEWTKTMDIKLMEGRDFDPMSPADQATACLINESTVSKMGLQNPVGSVVGGHTVIGVFQDFVFNNPTNSVGPMAVYLNPQHLSHLYVRVENNSKWRKAIDHIEQITKTVSPDYPFQFSFTKDEYQQKFDKLSDIGSMVSIFGGMTMFISCLGLFGLAGFIAEKRSKEMSIRKVFGANMIRILASLSGDFLKPVVYALLVVIPASVFIAQAALADVAYRVPLDWWMFASSAIIIIALGFIIVLYHGWRTARENPVKRLRNE